ncbi:hypothetical protein [Paracoccus contaminans]|uniref:hypothetical protein n=1 Tax=Paracoccus contaminans TaxID=1945662 RepID=UPI0012F4E0FF|nr:hypothetical protein [Paracoccus contaminans]
MAWRWFSRTPNPSDAIAAMEQIANSPERASATEAQIRARRAQASLLEMMNLVVASTARPEGGRDDR